MLTGLKTNPVEIDSAIQFRRDSVNAFMGKKPVSLVIQTARVEVLKEDI